MKKRNRFVAAAVCCALALAAVMGAAALFSDLKAAPGCICPLVYSPVKCSNGQTYPNLCIANCHHAKNCVPVIILPPPI
jgi:hypothetical protein